MLAILREISHNHFMVRRVNRELLDKWIHAHYPDGISRLALQSRVSAETIKKSRASGLAPKKPVTCELISEAMGVAVDDLFPLAPTKGKAS